MIRTIRTQITNDSNRTFEHSNFEPCDSNEICAKEIRAGIAIAPVMPEKLDPRKRAELKQLWFYEHRDYQYIITKLGIKSKSTVSVYIKELEQEIPEIKDLREVWHSMGKPEVFWKAFRFAKDKQQLDEWGVRTDQLPRVTDLLKAYGEKAPDVLDASDKYEQLLFTTGKPYDQLLSDYTAMMEHVGQKEVTIKGLNEKESKLRHSLANLEELQGIQEKIKARGLSIVLLDQFLDNSKALEDLGFTLEIARVLATELDKTGSDPVQASATIADLLKEGPTLKQAVATLSGNVKSLSRQEKELQETVGPLQNRVNKLSQDIKDIEPERDRQLEAAKREISELYASNRREEERRRSEFLVEIVDLAKKRDKMKSDYELAESVITLLKDPKTITDYQLEKLEKWILLAKEERQKGWTASAEIDKSIARDELIAGLREAFQPQIVAEIERLRVSLNSVTAENEQIRINEEAMKEQLRNNEDAMKKQLQTNANGLFTLIRFLSTPVLETNLPTVQLIECPICHKINGNLRYTESRVEDLIKKGSFSFKCGFCLREFPVTFKYLIENFMKHPDPSISSLSQT